MLASCEESVEFSGNLLDFLSESLMLCSWGVGMSEIESADLDEFAKQRDAAIEEVERLSAEIAAADAALDKYVGPHGWLDDSRPERIKKLEMLRDEAAAHADAFFKECGKVKEEIQGLRASIKHCDGCGGSWLDDGLNEGCACGIRVKAMETACRAVSLVELVPDWSGEFSESAKAIAPSMKLRAIEAIRAAFAAKEERG